MTTRDKGITLPFKAIYIDVTSSAYGAKFDGVTDDTVAIQAAINAAFAAGGGIVQMPPGTAIVSTLNIPWTTATVTINLRGAGKFVTVLKKTGVDTNPIINCTTVANPLVVFSEFSDFSISGNSNLSHGISISQCARFSMKNLYILNCNTGINIIGAELMSLYDVDVVFCTNGIVTRASGSVRCNVINIYSGSFNNHTGYGMDIGDLSGLWVHGTDIEHNGTHGNTGSGDVIIRSTCGTEFGFAQIEFDGTWHELNDGKGFTVENAVGLCLALKNVLLASNNSGSGLNVGTVHTILLDNVVCGGPNTVTLAAYISIIIGGDMIALTDNSLVQTKTSGVYTGYPFWVKANGAVTFIDPATGLLNLNGGATLLVTSTTLTNGSAAATGTLTNAPVAGNPTKWISINDAGVIRKIPAW